MNPNKLVLDLASNPDLSEQLAGISPGSEVEIEMTAQLDEATAETATFSVLEADIMEAEPMEAEAEAGMEGEEEGTPEEKNAMLVVVGGPPKRGRKGMGPPPMEA